MTRHNAFTTGSGGGSDGSEDGDMSSDPQWIKKLNKLSSVDTPSQAFTKLFFLPIAAAFYQMAEGIEAVSNIIIQPAQSFATGVASTALSVTSAPGDIISTGSSVTQGGIQPFGIIGFPVSVLLVGAGILALAYVLSREETSDAVPGALFDFPLVGTDEDEE